MKFRVGSDGLPIFNLLAFPALAASAVECRRRAAPHLWLLKRCVYDLYRMIEVVDWMNGHVFWSSGCQSIVFFILHWCKKEAAVRWFSFVACEDSIISCQWIIWILFVLIPFFFCNWIIWNLSSFSTWLLFFVLHYEPATWILICSKYIVFSIDLCSKYLVWGDDFIFLFLLVDLMQPFSTWLFCSKILSLRWRLIVML